MAQKITGRYTIHDVSRVSGSDRFATAVEISKLSHPDGASTVYIANGLNYPDALSAGPAAASDDAPLLLVAPTSLPGVVADELARLDPTSIVVIGGTPSVSAAVETQLAAIAPVTRVSGSDRYATSRAIVEYAFSAGAPLVYLATGANYPDALSAGAAGASLGAPVLLVNGGASGVDTPTLDALDALGASYLRIAGGTPSVSAGIEAELSALYTVERLGGADRFATSRLINAGAFGSHADAVLVATGMGYADALAGSPWAGQLGAPIFSSPQACLLPETLAQIDGLGASSYVLLGGEPSLGPGVLARATC